MCLFSTPSLAKESAVEFCEKKYNSPEEIIACVIAKNREDTPPRKGPGGSSPFAESPDYFKRKNISAPVFPEQRQIMGR